MVHAQSADGDLDDLELIDAIDAEVLGCVGCILMMYDTLRWF